MCAHFWVAPDDKSPWCWVRPVFPGLCLIQLSKYDRRSRRTQVRTRDREEGPNSTVRGHAWDSSDVAPGANDEREATDREAGSILHSVSTPRQRNGVLLRGVPELARQRPDDEARGTRHAPQPA